ncbi:MAG: DUF222 domain-containing protein [Actinomycetota bacterium]
MKVMARPSFDEVVESLDRRHTRLCADLADLLETISYLDREEAWGDDETSLECFLSARYGVGSGTAFEWVRVARALRDLPAIRDAFGAGRISWDQLRPLTRFATQETDEQLSVEAPGMRLGKLWTEARRNERREKQRQLKEDRQLRYARMTWDEEKRFLHIEADLPGEQGAAVEVAARRRAEEITLEDDVLYMPSEARLADAIAELITSSGTSAQPPTLVVHADASVLTSGGGRLGETESGVQLADDTVQRLACDARIEWVLEADGRAVGIGRQGRTVPGWLGRPLRFRDPECRFDGCSRRSGLISHHIVPWARGGPTDLDNLVRLCPRHHRLMHEAGWRIRGHPAQRLTFYRPEQPRRRAPALLAASFP